MRLSGTARLSLKTNLSYGHLHGAAILAGKCSTLERDHQWPASDPILAAHGTFANASVILAACALEAWANEYHHDILDRNVNTVGKALQVAEKVQLLWDTVERLPILRKYQWFLQLVDATPFDEGGQPFQAVADLLELRDALVHYKPEWSSAAKQNARLEARLGSKFPPNRLSTPDQLFIPYRCLGCGSGTWGVRTILAFMKEFCRRTDRKDLTNAYESRIETALAGIAV